MVRFMRGMSCALLLAALGCGGDDGGGDGTGTDDGGQTMDSPCMRGCEATLEADCAMGPATLAECVEDCERLLQGDCASYYRILMRCSEAEGNVSCSDSGLPVVAACDTEQNAFVACLND